jgi:hypothetical protein
MRVRSGEPGALPWVVGLAVLATILTAVSSRFLGITRPSVAGKPNTPGS